MSKRMNILIACEESQAVCIVIENPIGFMSGAWRLHAGQFLLCRRKAEDGCGDGRMINSVTTSSKTDMPTVGWKAEPEKPLTQQAHRMMHMAEKRAATNIRRSKWRHKL